MLNYRNKPRCSLINFCRAGSTSFNFGHSNRICSIIGFNTTSSFCARNTNLSHTVLTGIWVNYQLIRVSPNRNVYINSVSLAAWHFIFYSICNIGRIAFTSYVVVPIKLKAGLLFQDFERRMVSLQSAFALIEETIDSLPPLSMHSPCPLSKDWIF